MSAQYVSKYSFVVVILVVFLSKIVFLTPAQAIEPPISSDFPKDRIGPPEEPGASTYEKTTGKTNLIAAIDASYVHSDLDGSDPLSGGAVKALLAPTYRINADNLAIFMYDGNYHKKREFYSDDVGSLERSEYQRHSLTPMVRMNLGNNGRYFLTPSFFYTATLNKDFESSDWNDGLYNYTDLGLGLDFEMRDLGFSDGDGHMKLGTQLYQRGYPNFSNSLMQDYMDDNNLPTDGKDDKDYNGIILRAGYFWTHHTGFSWNANYSLLLKMLTDKKVIDPFLTSTKQQDLLHALDIRLFYKLNPNFNFGLDFITGIKDSNQNYLDTNVPNVPYVYTPDFYSHSSYAMKPKISYTLSRIPLTASFSYAWMKLEYSSRKAKDTNGNYKSEKHWEEKNEILLDIRYNINKNWSVIGYIQQQEQTSNNEDESLYIYEYTVNNYSIGASYKY